MKRAHLFLGIGSICALTLGTTVIFWPFGSAKSQSGTQQEVRVEIPVPVVPKDEEFSIEVTPGSTFSVLLEEQGMPTSQVNAIYAASKDVYDLARIRAGKIITLKAPPAQEISQATELLYPASVEEELIMKKEGDTWKAELKKVEYEVRQKEIRGNVESSLYSAGLQQNMDERAIIAMADVFQWTIDFAQDVRSGDSFSVIYEELYRDGAYVMPGKVLAASYTNSGKKYQAFAYTNAKGEEGYYDENGQSLRRLFLKAPLSFKYITSGFTTGKRYVAAFNVSTGHRAIDYAAAKGTPIRATAAGTVVFSGWNGPYGNFVSIRHNGTYTTNYAHQSKIAVKKGQKVEQGQVIGYVGSTGFSTGPHLHYEMVKNGTKINPMNETFPGTDPIPPEELEQFTKAIQPYVISL